MKKYIIITTSRDMYPASFASMAVKVVVRTH